MFQERLKVVIERQCGELRRQTGEIGQTLALCNPYQGTVAPADLAGLSEACADIGGRSTAIGFDGIARAAAALAGALGELESRTTVEPWELVRVMALQGDLASAVDELEADTCALYAGCTTAAALTVAPMPEFP